MPLAPQTSCFGAQPRQSVIAACLTTLEPLRVAPAVADIASGAKPTGPPHLSTLRGTGPNPTKGRLGGIARRAPLQGRSHSYVWREASSHPIGGMRAPVPYPLSRTRRDPVPNPTNLRGTAATVPMETIPASVSDSFGWHGSTNLGKKRNTPQPHLRAPKPGCRLATAQRSCCHQAESMDKSLASPILENVLSVAKRLGVCRSTIHAWVQKGLFPEPIKLGRSSRWLTSEVDAWIELSGQARMSLKVVNSSSENRCAHPMDAAER